MKYKLFPLLLVLVLAIACKSHASLITLFPSPDGSGSTAYTQSWLCGPWVEGGLLPEESPFLETDLITALPQVGSTGASLGDEGPFVRSL